jgi:hypothetical protein
MKNIKHKHYAVTGKTKLSRELKKKMSYMHAK